MSALSLLFHPPAPRVRQHLPRGYETVEPYKQWLRDDFAFTCGYCCERERWHPDGANSFSIDHVLARSIAAALIRDYSNLLYAGVRCNSAKQARTILDPTVDSMHDHLRLGEDGILVGLTPRGLDFIDILALNDLPASATRRDKLRLLRLRLRYPHDPDIAAMFLHAFGYPEDKPDLRRANPPGGNANEGSEERCHFARGERGELPATY